MSNELGICGGCTACCKALAIPELEKPVQKWCAHCAIGKGCKVYDSRPPSCQTYLCTWYQSVEEGHPWPADLRPDRCHAVIDFMPASGAHYVRVDPNRPDAWKAPKVHSMLRQIAEEGFPVFLVIGEKCLPLKLVTQ